MTDFSEPTPCVQHPNVFLHPLLDDGQGVTTQANRREQAMLRNQASKLCAECPLQAKCLTDAVCKFEVSGFVAGTTKRQRQEIRTRLGVSLGEDDLDSYAGVSSGRQFDQQEIYRLRVANPTEPLSSIAARIGCSVSTVKRHLRRIERDGLPVDSETAPPPSPDHVLAVAQDVRRGNSRGARAA